MKEITKTQTRKSEEEAFVFGVSHFSLFVIVFAIRVHSVFNPWLIDQVVLAGILKSDRDRPAIRKP